MRVALVGVLAVLASPAGAQAPVLRLSMEEAVAVAREHNPTFARTRNDLEVAGLGVRGAWAAYLPTLSVGTGLSGSYSRTVTGFNDFGELIRRDDPLVIRGSGMSQSLNIGLPFLFDGGRRRSTLRSAHAATRVTEADIARQALELRAQVSLAYVEHLAARLRERFQERQLASEEARLEMTEQLFRVANADRIDVLGAREQLATRESGLARARSTSEQTRIALLAQLGREQVLDVELTDTVLPLFDPKQLDVEQLVATALRVHPSARGADASLEAVAHELRAQKGGRWPSLSPSISYSRGISRRDYDAFTDLRLPENQSVGFGVSLNYRVFDGFQTSNLVQRAEASLQDAEHQNRLQRQTIERDVRTALIALENAFRTLELSRLSSGIATERLELATEQYRLGSTSYAVLQDLIERAASGELGELDARVAFAQALIQLEQRVGQPIRP